MRGASPIGGGDAHAGPVVNRRTRGSRRIDAGRVDLQKGVDQLARSVEQIEISLRRAERRIAADAEDRVRKLRTEAGAQLVVLRGYEREAMRILIRLSSAANGSWGDLKRAADRALKDARKIAALIVKRCRRVVSE
jgi:hypothetical protein